MIHKKREHTHWSLLHNSIPLPGWWLSQVGMLLIFFCLDQPASNDIQQHDKHFLLPILVSISVQQWQSSVMPAKWIKLLGMHSGAKITHRACVLYHWTVHFSLALHQEIRNGWKACMAHSHFQASASSHEQCPLLRLLVRKQESAKG